MKNYLHIIIFSFLLITSCGTSKKSQTKSIHANHTFEDYSRDYNIGIKKDSIHYDIKDDIIVGMSNPESEQHQVQQEEEVTSHGENYSEGISDYAPKKKLNVVTVKNTTVKEKSNLSEGRIVYKIPEKMKILSTYNVLVRISKSKSTVSIYDSLSGNVIASDIPITETMEVKLIDLSPKEEKAFDIVKEDNSIQIIDSTDSYTQWSWSVTPLHVGNSKLEILVSVIRGDAKKDIVYTDTIEVEKDIPTQIMFFIEEYWKWLITTFIIPFVIWFYKKRKAENRKKSHEKDTSV